MDFDPRDVDTREQNGFQIEELRWSGDPRDQDDRERDCDRDRDGRDHDPREPFVAALELPRCPERELVPDARDNLYELNREDSLMLATIGVFASSPSGTWRTSTTPIAPSNTCATRV
jgi:hypothetical protein